MREAPSSASSRVRIVGAFALAAALLAGACQAADPLEPRLPWSPGGWTPTNWLGFALYVGGFLLVAALILRLGSPPAEEPEPPVDRASE